MEESKTPVAVDLPLCTPKRAQFVSMYKERMEYRYVSANLKKYSQAVSRDISPPRTPSCLCIVSKRKYEAEAGKWRNKIRTLYQMMTDPVFVQTNPDSYAPRS